MNALSNLIPFRVARKGMAEPSPSAERLATISLQTSREIPPGTPPESHTSITNHTPSPNHTANSGGTGLSGLIRRREPIRFDPLHEQADHEAAEAAMAKRNDVRLNSTRRTTPEPQPSQTGKHSRRQHTVRLVMDKSDALNLLAKQSDRTYQSILSEAICDYLAR